MLAITPTVRTRGRRNILKVIAGALAVTTATLFGGLAPASAAVGDSSSARGQFLSGSLLGTDLATLAALQGAQASSDGSADDLDTGTLSVAVLQALQLDVPGGLQIPLDAVDLGVLDQYAAANADGSALGASGAVANDGAIGPVGPGGAPTAFTFDLSDLLGGVVSTAAVTDLNLELGAVSAQATGDGVSAPTGDYEIAGLRLVIDSPAVAGVSAAVETAVDDVVDPLVTGLVGPGGSVLSTITAAIPGATLGVVGAGATLDLDLDAALDPLIGPAAPALGAGSPIEIDLGTGVITVDVRALLESDADPTNDLNSLAPNTEILSAEVLTLITDGVESLLDDLADDIAAAVVTAVNNAQLTLDLNVDVFPLGNVATIHVGGTIAELMASTPGSVTVNVLNAAVCSILALICGTLGATVLGALDTLLTGAVDGLVDDVLAGVQADVIAPLLVLLDPALASVVTDIVSLRANVQEPTPPLLTQEFVETALRLTVLGVTMPGGGAVELNLAQAAVGPNVAVNPVTTIDDITPDSGPEAGGTNVVITGHCFLGATAVTFGGVAAASFTVVSDTEIDAVTPPGVGLVDVVVVGAGTCGSDTEPDGFAFVGPNAPVILALTPPEGPDDGGTLVTITGAGFTGVTSVTFDGIPGTSLIVISDTELTVVTPPHVAEVVDVVVSHPVNGDSAPLDFEYIEAAVGGVTQTPGVLGLTGSSPWTGLFSAIQLLLVGFSLVMTASLRRRRRLL